MIDIHCHILPGIDDGANTLADSIRLLNIAMADGITHIVATPHIHPGRFDNDLQSIQSAYQTLAIWIKKNQTPIKLSTAAEVRISVEVLSMLDKDSIPFVGEWDGYNVMLLEMPHSHILPGSDKLVKLLLKNNIRPLIAHPERNKEIMADPEKIKPFVDAGCLLQLTSGSIVGRFGAQAKKISEYLLQENVVTLIATDAHNEKYRPPKLAEGYARVTDILGADYSQQLKQNVQTLVSSKIFNA